MRAKEFDIAKFILILGVILAHSNLYADKEAGFSTGGKFLMTLIPGAMCSVVVVPLFFVIAGFLYFKNVNRFTLSVYVDKCKRRVHSLLIPYLLWNFIGLIILIFKSTVLGYPSFGIITDHHLNISKVFECFWGLKNGYPVAFAFWFIRNLIIFSVISPVSYLIAKNRLLFIALILLICIFNISLYGFEFFLIGSFAALNYNGHYVFKKNFAITGCIVWLSLSLFKTLTNYWIEPLLLIDTLAVGYPIFYLSYKLTAFDHSQIMRMLLRSTFCLYALHQFYCTIIRKAYGDLFGINTTFGVAIAFIATWLTLIGLSFLLWAIFQKLFPRLIAVLSGNRS